MVQDDADPLDPVEVDQQPPPLAMPRGEAQAANDPLGRRSAERGRNRHLGLADEIADQLGRIVPSGILEIDEGDPAVRHQGVVEAEIRGRDDKLGGRQFVVVGRSGPLPQAGPDGSPGWDEMPRDEPLREVAQRHRGVEGRETPDAALHGGDMPPEAETGLGPRLQVQRSARRPVDREQERDRRLDVTLRHGPTGETLSRQEGVEAQMGLAVAGERLGNVANPASPDVGEKGPFRAEPVPVIPRVMKVGFQNKGTAVVEPQAKDLVVLAAGEGLRLRRQGREPCLAHEPTGLCQEAPIYLR